MANTFSTGSVKNLSLIGSTVLQSVLAPLARFCRVGGLEQNQVTDLKALDVVVPVASVAPATQVDPTNFESGDTTVTAASLPMHLYAQTFGANAGDIQSGLRPELLVELNARAFGEKLWDVVAALLTTGNFGSPVVTNAPATWGGSDFDTMLGAVSSQERSVILDTPYFVKVKPTWLPPRFDSVFESSRWSAAGANVRGLVGDPRAILLRWGIPILAEQGIPYIAREPIVIPQLGITCEFSMWQSLQSRSMRCAFLLYFAAAVGDANALKLLTSA